jgi:geranylgeranyl transferase type-2 subunit beta
LTTRLAEGLAQQPEEFRARHATFLAAAQNSDGGFSGREGGSDLYYTAFALRGLAILDVLTPEICARAGAFLRSRLQGQASVVDFYSLLFACLLVQLGAGPDVLGDCPDDWPVRVALTLEGFRAPDGGYGKTSGAASSSTYHTFLVGLCYEILGLPWPRPDAIEGFIKSRHREDGGFVEIPAMRRSGTNPTAAAVGIWNLLHGPDTPLPQKDKVSEFLGRMPALAGGLRANDRIPLADLLSTFTGLWTMDQLGGQDRLDRDELCRFVMDLEDPRGGFRAGLWDEVVDVEYTFYGLGTMALLTTNPV